MDFFMFGGVGRMVHGGKMLQCKNGAVQIVLNSADPSGSEFGRLAQRLGGNRGRGLIKAGTIAYSNLRS
jgi:hypothetical protein